MPLRFPAAAADGPFVVFDASHGQERWAQTGFDARTLTTNFLELSLAGDSWALPASPAHPRPSPTCSPTPDFW